MINNEHNPIAIRISNIQDLWIEHREKTPDAKIYCLACEPADFQIVEGFIRLEASEYGRTPDIIVGFKTDYNDTTDFYRFLIKEWITSFLPMQKRIQTGNGRIFPPSSQNRNQQMP